MNDLLNQISQAKAFLLEQVGTMPRYVITLGSGLSGVIDGMETECEFRLSEIPFLRVPTVQGHRGRVVVGKLHGARVLAMQGRLHCYEGYPMSDVVFPFRALASAGAEYFFLTNAAGGLHPEMVPSDLVLIRDHINMMGDNPLIGPNFQELGPRFPDVSQTYEKELGDSLVRFAQAKGIKLYEGIYLANKGPSFETPAEVRMYRGLGATVVGMSTVPEAIALKHMGKKILAISCVTNLAAGITDAPLNHADVMEVATRAYPTLGLLFQAALNELEKGKRA